MVNTKRTIFQSVVIALECASYGCGNLFKKRTHNYEGCQKFGYDNKPWSCKVANRIESGWTNFRTIEDFLNKVNFNHRVGLYLAMAYGSQARAVNTQMIRKLRTARRNVGKILLGITKGDKKTIK